MSGAHLWIRLAVTCLSSVYTTTSTFKRLQHAVHSILVQSSLESSSTWFSVRECYEHILMAFGYKTWSPRVLSVVYSELVGEIMNNLIILSCFTQSTGQLVKGTKKIETVFRRYSVTLLVLVN